MKIKNWCLLKSIKIDTKRYIYMLKTEAEDVENVHDETTARTT